jgi:hypothetical protein
MGKTLPKLQDLQRAAKASHLNDIRIEGFQARQQTIRPQKLRAESRRESIHKRGLADELQLDAVPVKNLIVFASLQDLNTAVRRSGSPRHSRQSGPRFQ